MAVDALTKQAQKDCTLAIEGMVEAERKVWTYFWGAKAFARLSPHLTTGIGCGSCLRTVHGVMTPRIHTRAMKGEASKI